MGTLSLNAVAVFVCYLFYWSMFAEDLFSLLKNPALWWSEDI